MSKPGGASNRRTRHRRLAAALRRGTVAVVAAVVAAATAGCGIRPTSALGFGEPVSGNQGGYNLYLVHEGKVFGTLRQVDFSRIRRPIPSAGVEASAAPARNKADFAGPEAALDELFAGVNRAERAAGLTSELPGGLERVADVVVERGEPARVDLDQDPAELSELAVQQIACTLAAVRPDPTGGTRQVRLTGPGEVERAPVRCPDNVPLPRDE
jgi:hypothetical protein